MTRDAAILGGCLLLAFVTVVGALRCIADRLLTSAVIYALVAAAFLGGAARAAIDAF